MSKYTTIENIHIAKNQDANVLKLKTERNGWGVLKTLVVILLIVVQASIFLLSYLYFISFFRWFSLFSFIMSFITSIYVLSTSKNSQSKPIWILFLLVCSSFGYIVYFISNERFFWGKYKKRYNKILEKSNKYISKTNDESTNILIKNECKYFETSGNFTTFSNTDTKYFPSGSKFFDSIFADLEKAKQFIFMEFFIISNGNLLKKIISILEEKVKQGVDVRIIYDDLGSHGSFKNKTKKNIKNKGIKLLSFNKLLPRFSAILNYRDHRKIIVIDGRIAYTGGTNLADEYINEKRLHGYWKDAGIRLNGPAVDGFSLMFLRQWEFVSNKEENYARYLNLSENTDNKYSVIPYADGLEYPDNIGKNAYTNLISNANHMIYIMSPYFVIDDTINNLLINKAKSGVDVRIILPDIADKKFVYIISRNNAEKLTAYGVKVYTMNNSFVHSKVLLTENSAIVGSINMDLRSFYQQFESAVYLNDEQTLLDIEKDFLSTFTLSTQLNSTNLKRNKPLFRVIAGITNLISPFM